MIVLLTATATSPVVGTIAPDEKGVRVVLPGSADEEYLRDIVRAGEGGERDRVPFTPLWGTDVLISDETQGYPIALAMDVADDGDIFVAIAREVSGSEDVIQIMRSSDGRTWSQWRRFETREVGTRGVDIAVGPGADPWVYLLVDVQGSSGEDLSLFRVRASGSSPSWIPVVSGSTDTVLLPSISVNNDGVLALSYVSTSGEVYRGLSTDEGSTWDVLAANSGVSYASIFMSENGRGYHAYVQNDTLIWIVTFDSPDLFATYVRSIRIGGDTAYSVSVTASDGTPSAQKVVAVYSNRHSSGNYTDVHWTYSTDGGENFQPDDVFPPDFGPSYPSGSEALYPYVHRDRNAISFRFVFTYYDGGAWDTVFYSYSSSGTSGWGNYLPINEYRGTGSFGPRVDQCQPTGGGCVVYRGYASDSVWFDGYTFTAVEETYNGNLPLISVVNGGIKTTGKVLVYSTDGRLIASGSGYIELRSGLYFVRSGKTTLKVIVR